MKPTRTIYDGPTFFHGAPNLRDESIDLVQWGKIPIPMKIASICMNVGLRTLYMWVDDGNVQPATIGPQRMLRLGDMPQTARCQWIERAFSPTTLPESENYLFRANELLATGMFDHQRLHYLVNIGEIIREVLPGGGHRYPFWGMEKNLAKQLREKHLYS